MTISRTLRHFLQEQHADYEVIPHESTHSAMQSALASSVPADQVAKAVLLDTEDGYLLAVLPANHRIMLSDLTAEFGRRPQLVEEDRLGFIFNDCDRGAIPALASGYDIPLIVDDNIDRQPDIYFEAGDHESLIHMSHDEFSRLTANARHGNFSMHEAMLH
ncbi:MAG TPA: YbaK/EbsC family protein [Rhizorhapis sp.]